MDYYNKNKQNSNLDLFQMKIRVPIFTKLPQIRKIWVEIAFSYII